MPILTKKYKLTAFLDGDTYDSIADKNRFVTVDNQLFAISSLIDDGYIDGWDFSETEELLTISISSGSGFINKRFINTFAEELIELSANGTFYFFAQRKSGLTGTIGPRSNLSYIEYIDDGVPSAITGLSIEATGSFEISLNWIANTEIDLSHYEIWKGTDGVLFSLFETINISDNPSYSDIDVDEQETYYYKIFAVDLSGNKSTAVNGFASTPLSSSIPPDPLPLDLIPSVSAINVLWQTPTSILFSKIDHYKISYVKLYPDETQIDDSLVSVSVSKNSLYYRIDDLSIGEKYKVIIQTVDSKSRESSGIHSSITVPNKSTAPLDPSSVSYTTEVGQFGLTVNLYWQPGDNEYGSVPTYRYRIYVQPYGGSESLPIDVPIGFTNEQVSLFSYDNINWLRIDENTVYSFRITALSNLLAIDNESLGTVIRIGTPQISLPDVLKNIISEFNFNDGTITITWNLNQDTSKVLIRIYRTDLEDAYFTDVLIVDSDLGRSSKYVLSDVILDSKYVIIITPVDSSGQEGLSSTTSTLTLISGTVIPPILPVITTVSSGDKSMTIEWKEPDDLSVKQYNIYRKSGDVTLWFSDWTLIDTLPREMTSFIDYGLTNDQLYSYFITSVNVYGTETPGLSERNYNMNFVQDTPTKKGTLTEPYNVSVSLGVSSIEVQWQSISDSFDAFTIYRSKNNLHSWEKVGTVDSSTFSFADTSLPLINGTIFYYTVNKTINDADFIVLTENVSPSNSIALGYVKTDLASITEINQTSRRLIKDFHDPIEEYTLTQILQHNHLDPRRIQLSENVIVSDWTTVDGKVFVTSDDIVGSDYVLKVNGRIPTVFYSIVSSSKSIIFSEPIGSPSNLFDIQLTVIGTGETDGVLSNKKFDNLTATQAEFGELNVAQLPIIDHEGRIKEPLLPSRFNLQRYSDYEFIIPEKNTDSSKTFGDGTCFYSIIESDGLLDSIVDFDSASVGEINGFQRPSFSQTTRLNLASSVYEQEISSGLDNAFDINSLTWEPNPSVLQVGSTQGSDSISDLNDIYLKFIIDVPKNAIISESSIVFTAVDSLGTDVFLDIFLLDYSIISSSVDFSNSLRTIPTVGNVTWVPEEWIAEQQFVTPDLTDLLQAYINSDSYTPGNAVFFKIKTESITTGNNYRFSYGYLGDSSKAPFISLSYVLDTAQTVDDPTGFYNNNSYLLEFQFKDASDYRWVRITTENTSSTPNPVLDLGKRIRFRLKSNISSFFLSLGIREITSENIDPGNNGGTSGPIEWVGVSSVLKDPNGNSVPIGLHINADPDEWQEIDIDLADTTVISFQNGDGVLSSKFGVLEHLAITIDPTSENADQPISINIDKIEQITDILVAGTSQGILLSKDFGTTWSLSRYTSTPVLKFYRAVNNRFIWAISNNEVLIATDPAFWFSTIGTFGIHSIKDITEDDDGNMFISSDKGVYWFDISLISQYSLWQQTLPTNAFTTDTHGMYHNFIPSGLSEIWASTEVGIFKTSDHGTTWTDSGLTTGNLPAIQIFNVSSNPYVSVLIAITNKSIYIKTDSDTNFRLIADLEEQHGLYDIWKAIYFNNTIYISTSNGILYHDYVDFSAYVNNLDFTNKLSGIDLNSTVITNFGLDVITNHDNTEILFIGQEGRLYTANSSNTVSVRFIEHGKKYPIFYLDQEIISIGYSYNTFNKILCFKAPVESSTVASSAFIPLQKYIALHRGWALSNPLTDVFIYVDGLPKWIDFKIDNNVFINDINAVSSNISLIREALDSINSLYPESVSALDSVISIIQDINSGGPIDSDGNTTTNITNSTVKTYLISYVYFLSLVTDDFKSDNSFIEPRLMLYGFPRDQRNPASKAESLESQVGIIAENSTGISINVYTGTVDFTTAIQGATSLLAKSKFNFSKFTKLTISVLNSNLSETGDFTHSDAENKMEEINTGLSVGLTDVMYGNFLQSGIVATRYLGDVFVDTQSRKIQTEYFPVSQVDDWYEITNSTVDHKKIIDSGYGSEANYITNIYQIENEPYFNNVLWATSNNGIFVYQYSSDGLSLLKVIQVNSSHNFIYSIYQSSLDEIFAITLDTDTMHSFVYMSTDFGDSWTLVKTLNLPNSFYYMTRINGNDILSTSQGQFYSDNSFNTWYPATVSLSKKLTNTSILDNFKNKAYNIINNNYIIIEINGQFYRSTSGIDYLAVGPIGNSVNVINKIFRFKNITFAGTEKGIYSDGNSVMSDLVSFGLHSDIEDTKEKSESISINDIDSMNDKLYCCGNNAKLYRYYDDGTGQKWTNYQVPGFSTIHYIKTFIYSSEEFLAIISNDTIGVVNVTDGIGVFG